MDRKRGAKRPLHPISVVAERTGVSVDVLRVWERRYGVVEPARDESGRRLYTDDDIERLRLLAQAAATGRSVGRLTTLPPDDLRRLVRGDESAKWAAQRPPAAGSEPATFVAEALVRARVLDGGGVEEVLTRAAALFSATAFLSEVVAPLFRSVGDEWHAGGLSIAQEHLATSAALTVLGRIRSQLPVPPGAPVIVIATLSQERHEIGALLVAAMAAAEGWRVTYLGADVPVEEVAHAATVVSARAVAISSICDGAGLVAELAALRSLIDPEVLLLAGGAAADLRRHELGDVAGLMFIADLDHLRRALATAAA